MKRYILRITAVLMVVLAMVPAFGQGWLNIYEEIEPVYGNVAAQTPDGGYMLVGGTDFFGSNSMNIIKTDANGELIFNSNPLDPDVSFGAIGDIIPAQGGGYYVSGMQFDTANGSDFHLYKITETGTIEWSAALGNFSFPLSGQPATLQQDVDGNIYLVGSTQFPNVDRHLAIHKVSATGELIWAMMHEEVTDVAAMELTSDGNILVTGAFNFHGYIGSYSKETGEAFSFQELDDDSVGLDLITDNDGVVTYLGASFLGPQDFYKIRKFENDGTLISATSIPSSDYPQTGKLKQLPTGGFIILGGPAFFIELIKTNEAGDEIIWTQNHENLTPESEEQTQLLLTDDGGFAIAGYLYQNGSRPFLAKADSLGFIHTNQVVGTVGYDINENCLVESTEMPLAGWIVELAGDNGSYYYSTEADGSYEFLIDEGDYELTVYLPNTLWEVVCPTTPISVAGAFSTVYVDVPVQAAEDCSAMTVDIGVTNLRRCTYRTYWVDYCNDGTLPAEDATIEVQIDDSLLIVSTSIEPISQDENFLTFDIGDVEIGECGSLSIDVFIPCDVTFAYMHCSNAHIYPDAPCGDPDPNWSGASIEVRGECENNELVKFEIENVGTASMASALDFVIIEDEMILLNGNFDLTPAEIMPVDLPATGATFIINAEQEPNHPGFSMPTTFVQGCGGLANSFIINWLPLDDANTFYDEDCTVNTDSYDPNEKLASPRGWGEAHLLEPNVDLEYQINFQNEGNDTAFIVVVLDTLPATLDFSTFREMTSSFPYELALESTEEGLPVLKYTFTDINLLPKSWDEPASQGFLKYSIAQQPDLAIGTTIENRAGIYFDFNAPVITEYAFHTIGIDFIEIVDVKELSDINLIINIAPNPTFNKATVTIPELQDTAATLYLNDAIGKKVQTVSLINGRAELDAESLAAGIYFLQIMQENALIGTAKLIVR